MPARKEVFPIDFFRYLEGKIQHIRCLAMVKAAELAERECKPGDSSFVVEKYHVDKALSEIIDNPQKLLEFILSS